MADYYSKTAELFLRSGYYLFHAAALYKRLALYREHKKAPSVEELSALGSKALCAALSVPLPHARAQFSVFSGEYNQAKQKALASLLGKLYSHMVHNQKSPVRVVIFTLPVTV